MNHRKLLTWAFSAAIVLGALAPAAMSAEADDLAPQFAKPPDSARPWVYWFWLNSNITREGITADLEAMKRVGIGGVLIMEVDQGAPVGPVAFMGPQWRELFKYMVAEAGRLGLEVNMNDDAGWNGSGGPWIKPEQSMQKVVWTETDVDGPKRFDGTLPQPKAEHGFYRDITVLAFPAPGAFRIDHIRGKAAYERQEVAPASDVKLPAEMVIDQARIADLTSRMDKDSRLAWDVPAGKWTVLRIGHTCTGAMNSPSPASGKGLECDKLSKEGIEAQFAGMMGPLVGDVGGAAGKTLVATHIDSWENGSQNWTARMREEFQKRRGYDPLPFLPTLSGRVVEGMEVSERFLWDLRQTVSDLVVENYAGQMEKLAQAHGLRLSIEAYGGPCDSTTYGGRADEPMCEFWMGGGAFDTVKGMASSAHTYGRRILGAESFTAGNHERWLDHPASIKTLGDRAFCDGVNRFVFHRYAMQPWLNYKPGMTMGPWGLHYERTQTWWEESRPWHEYLARCQFMLRQGLFVADLLYLLPEGSPHGFPGHPRVGYDYDNASAEVVLTRLTVKDGRLVLPDGMSYRVLVIPAVSTMTPPLLRKIRDLVREGATVIGSRPTRSPSLTDYPKCDEEVKRLADELWGDCDGKAVTEHRFGQGRVVCGVAPERLLAQAGVRPDFSIPARLHYIHRAAGDTDIYFVANPQASDATAACTFRVGGKCPELWRPESGRIERAAVFAEHDGVTTVVLHLGPAESVFVVFRKGAEPLDPIVAVARDGKGILAAVESAPKIVVKKAVYGVLSDSQRTRDVRDKVQQRVDGGDYHIAVAGLAEGDDPAPMIVKTLVVEYTVDDHVHVVTGKDHDTVHLAGDATKIVVEKAVYGVPGDAKRTRDVRAKVQQMADAGESTFQVARLAAGDDPAYGVVKTLVVDFTVEGHRITVTGTDPETVSLTEAAAAAETVAEIRCGADGRPFFEAWQPGRYELKTASGKTKQVDVPAIPQPLELTGPWLVRFPPGWGAPEQVTLERLTSWSEHADPGIKHFSGAATYSRKFNVPPEMVGKNRRLVLDLGKVAVMAEVKLNGRDLGILWKPPFRVDVTDVARAGENDLEVRVVNLWINRMIGDEQLPDDSDRNANGTLKGWPAWVQEGKPSPTGRFTFTSWRLWKKTDPLVESGLMGPVTLRAAEVAIVQP